MWSGVAAAARGIANVTVVTVRTPAPQFDESLKGSADADTSCIDVLLEVERTLTAVVDAMARASAKPNSPPSAAFGVSEPVIHQFNVRVRVSRRGAASERAAASSEKGDPSEGARRSSSSNCYSSSNSSSSKD